MKKKKTALFLVLLIIVFQSFCFAAETPPPRYKWIESDENRGVFFDTQTIKYAKKYDGTPNRDIVDLWLYFACNDGEVQRIIQHRKIYKLNTEDWKDLSYYLSHYQFNLKSKSIKFLSEIYYTSSGKTLDKYEYPNSWDEVIPNSAGEYWLEEVYRYVIANQNILEWR